MRNLKNNLTTSGKGSTNIQSRRAKSFGYQVLGFGSGGGPVAAYTVATGGTITESGDYKIHTFTGTGTFAVSEVGNLPANPGGGPAVVDYMVIAGGGGGGGCGYGGGGGAGGYRESHSIPVSGSYTASPLATSTGITITAQDYPITVGGGGAGGPGPYPGTQGCNGSNSIFSSITSAGGGGGARENRHGTAGGSGGGASYNATPEGGRWWRR
mgnify:FL=1